jgi:AmiR/NasT family two-component response regulator
LKSTTLSIDLRNIHCAVVHPRDRDGELLIRYIQRMGGRVVNQWPPGETLDQPIDVLFCVLEPAALTLLRLATTQSDLAVIGILDTSSSGIHLLKTTTPHALLVRPLETHAILGQILLALHNAHFQARQQSKIIKLEDTLRSYRKVEQAKVILMSRRKIGEPEAYGYLREQAMRRRVSIGTLATAIVDTSEMLSEEQVEESRE